MNWGDIGKWNQSLALLGYGSPHYERLEGGKREHATESHWESLPSLRTPYSKIRRWPDRYDSAKGKTSQQTVQRQT